VEEEAFETFPGGIVNKEETTAYIVSPGGAVEAIELRSGKKLWSSTMGGIPVAIEGNTLYALAPTAAGSEEHPALQVIGLSLKGEGKLVSKSKPIAVDEWVAGDMTGKNFSAAARIEDKKLVLSWSFSAAAAPEGGPRRVVRPMPAREVKGNARIDLEKGEVEIVKSDKALVSATSASSTAFAGLEFAAVVDDDTGRVLLTCTDHKTRKAIWAYTVEPGAVGSAATKPAPGRTPPPRPTPPMPYFGD
jgi:hypothetical protein